MQTMSQFFLAYSGPYRSCTVVGLDRRIQAQAMLNCTQLYLRTTYLSKTSPEMWNFWQLESGIGVAHLGYLQLI